MISYELIHSTEGQTPLELIQEVVMAYQMFQGPQVAEHVLESVLEATEPCCFLMVLAGGTTRLMLMHTLTWYNTTFGIWDDFWIHEGMCFLLPSHMTFQVPKAH